jgi:hypothetical protein
MLKRVLVTGKELTPLNLIYPLLVLIEGSICDDRFLELLHVDGELCDIFSHVRCSSHYLFSYILITCN